MMLSDSDNNITLLKEGNIKDKNILYENRKKISIIY